jgi:hypothetical protein
MIQNPISTKKHDSLNKTCFPLKNTSQNSKTNDRDMELSQKLQPQWSHLLAKGISFNHRSSSFATHSPKGVMQHQKSASKSESARTHNVKCMHMCILLHYLRVLMSVLMSVEVFDAINIPLVSDFLIFLFSRTLSRQQRRTTCIQQEWQSWPSASSTWVHTNSGTPSTQCTSTHLSDLRRFL